VKTAADTREILTTLLSQYPHADTELVFENPFQLLVATILSAQTTDRRVNEVTPLLFRRWPDAHSLARAPIDEVEHVVKPTGFFRQKSRTIVGMADALVERHSGHVPAEMSALVELPGVGRKTANVVLGHAFRVPGFAVDRHVLRVTNRIGIAGSEDPDEIEHQITTAIPSDAWTRASDTLILHGRRICKPRPLCDRCVIRPLCDFYRAVAGSARAAPSRPQATGRSSRSTPSGAIRRPRRPTPRKPSRSR
jgi:endonuclease III